MRAVLESGRLNLDVFGQVRSTDGVLKTLGDGGGLVVGNEHDGTAAISTAAAYVRDNRLGVRKVPEAGGASLDVAGDLACSGRLQLYDAVNGTSFADERVPRLTAHGGSLSLGMRGVPRRTYADARGTLDAYMVSSASFLRPYPDVSRPEDVPRVHLSDVRTRDDTVTKKRRVILRFGAANDGVAALDHLDRARAGDVLRFGEAAYRVSSAKYVHPAEAAADAELQEGLELTCEALPEIPYATGAEALPLSADVGEALKKAAESPSTTTVAVARLEDAIAPLPSAPFAFPLSSSACGTAVLSETSGTLRVRCVGSSRLMRHLKGRDRLPPRTVSSSEGTTDVLSVADVRPSVGFAGSFDVTLRSSSGMLSSAEAALASVATSSSPSSPAAAHLTAFAEDVVKDENKEMRLAGLTLDVRSRDATTGVIVFEVANDVYSRDLVNFLPFSATGETVSKPGSGPVVVAVARHGAPYVWIREARTEEKTESDGTVVTVVVLETHEPSDADETSAGDSLVQLAADDSPIAEELRFLRAGYDVRVDSTEVATDGKHLCLRTAEGGVSPEIREALYASRPHASAPDHVLVLSGPCVGVARPWRVCDVRPAGSSTTSMRLVLKRADGAALQPSSEDAITAIPWSDGDTVVRLRVAAFRKSVYDDTYDATPLLTPRGGVHVGADAHLSPAPAGVLLSLNGGSDLVVRDGGGLRFEGDAGLNPSTWRMYCDDEDRLRLGETEMTLRRGGHASLAGDLEVGGVLTARALHTPSDARLKTGIRDADYAGRPASALLRDLRVRRFRYRDDPEARERTGLVAQEAAAVHPRLVTTRQQRQHVDLQELLFLVLAGVQDLQRDNAELRSMVQRLEERVG